MFPSWVPFKCTFNRSRRLRFILEYLLGLEDIDIIVFNECFDSKVYRYLINISKSLYPFFTPLLGSSMDLSSLNEDERRDWIHVQKSQKWKQTFMNGGVFMLSKLKFESIRQEIYCDSLYSDCLASKGFICAQVMKNENRLNIIATHMQASYNPENEQIETRCVRRKQLTQIKASVDTSCVLVGDLNIRMGSEEYKEMMMFLDLSPDEQTIPSFDPATNSILQSIKSKSVPMTLDYCISLSGDKTNSKVLAIKSPPFKSKRTFGFEWGPPITDYSDHYPLFTSLELHSKTW